VGARTGTLAVQLEVATRQRRLRGSSVRCPRRPRCPLDACRRIKESRFDNKSINARTALVKPRRHRHDDFTPPGQTMATDGLTTIQSSFEPQKTMGRLEAAAKAKGLAVFARIDHAAGAAEVGLALRPTELLIFGNARGGTPLMQSNQTMGIDLPLKALVWQDAAGKTWLSYNDPSWLAQRHGLGAEAGATLSALAAALNALARAATSPP
jgi:uncharacterized protein (DUF302 family)